MSGWMVTTLLWLQGPGPGSESGSSNPAEIPWFHTWIFGNPWVMVGVFFLIFYLLLIRPQKRQQQQVQQMQEGLKKNDSVRTNAGFFGRVVSVDKDQDLVVLKIDESQNVRMRVLRSSIVAVVPDKK